MLKIHGSIWLPGSYGIIPNVPFEVNNTTITTRSFHLTCLPGDSTDEREANIDWSSMALRGGAKVIHEGSHPKGGTDGFNWPSEISPPLQLYYSL